jgi:hypothetical protein
VLCVKQQAAEHVTGGLSPGLVLPALLVDKIGAHKVDIVAGMN